LARGPAGHAILAGLPKAEQSALLDRTVPEHQRAALQAHLTDAARHGWAFAEECNQPGINGLATTVTLPPDPANAMALSVTGPSQRLTIQAAEKAAPLLMETSSRIAQVILRVRGATDVPT
jgi:IclR family acetate operon transcriptional repressor